MEDKKRCVRCDRAIDAYARICPYCNWDQSEPVPAVTEQPVATAPVYVPPPERTWRSLIKPGIGAVVLLVAAFVVGFFVHGNEPPNDAPQPISKEGTAPTPTAPRPDVTLVPVTDTSPLDQPITSAPLPNPAQGVPQEYQRSDATAVSSAEYAQLAERVKAEKKSQALIDPRTLTGAAYAQAPPPRRPAEESDPAMASSASDEPGRIVISTRPVPEYQPYPDISVSEASTARLNLTIGPDGRVQEVNVVNGVPGQTARIIETVQRWRFKPATENGQPVTAQFGVDLSFKPDE